MSEFKLTYFDLDTSRGEEIRIAFRIAGLSIDETRLSFDEFDACKSDIPFGLLPVVEAEGHGVITQTNTILRLIGRNFRLHPEEPFEAARHDEAMDAVEDLRHRMFCTMRLQDALEKQTARRMLAEDYLPKWGAGIERLIRSGPFLSGEKPNVADIKLYMAERWISSGDLDDIPVDTLAPFTKLKAVADGIRTHPLALK